jgi:putative ABC transport system permease protein
MTSAGFVVRLAWREAHAARRRLLLLTWSVVAGVGALVAVNSFTRNLTVAVAEQAQDLLGADLSIAGRAPTDSDATARRLLDSLRNSGGAAVRTARSANFAAMAYRPGSGAGRLVQVRTVDPGWPYYGEITTAPAGTWSELQAGGIIVDPSLLTTLGVKVGDTLALGASRFPIVATATNVPGDIGLQMAFGARVFIATSALPATRLIAFGSRADYETFIRLPSTINPQLVATANAGAMRRAQYSLHTIAEDRDSLTRGLIRLGNYLGLVALAALLLGGLGVASAVHVFIRQQLDSIAVLRCLGATSSQIFAAYLLQALGMALLGSLIGALAGVGLQQLMPYVVRDFLPVGVRVIPSPQAILVGIGSGLWTAAMFALLPLLGIRSVAPLVTLRRNVDPVPMRWDLLRIGAAVIVPASVVALAAIQVGSLRHAAAFAAGCGAALAVLWIASAILIAAARRWTPAISAYLPRQGLANLHRPANQTVTVVLALGFGAFILTTLFTAQQNLLRAMRIDDVTDRADLVLIDIQNEQRTTIDSILHAARLSYTPYVPIVPMRILDLKGEAVGTLVARDSARRAAGTDQQRANRPGPSPWAFRREFRSTYRADRMSSERLTAGRWFSRASGDGRRASAPVEISVEADLARELGVGIGDPITWDVQGVPIYSRVTSLRDVNWARFEPNFFVVFAPGALEQAPQSWVTMVRAPDPLVRGAVQRTVAEHAANVTAVDIGQMEHAVESVVDRVILAIRFMALFSLVTGTIVLIGAIATSRWQRIREGTLLRTLGATRRQVLVILCVEYAALGLSASLVAVALAGGAGWALAKWVFDTHFVLPIMSMAALGAALVALTTVVGLANSVEALNRPPLEVLRAD